MCREMDLAQIHLAQMGKKIEIGSIRKGAEGKVNVQSSMGFALGILCTGCQCPRYAVWTSILPVPSEGWVTNGNVLTMETKC